MSSQLYACPNTTTICSQQGKRFYEQTKFCAECGTKTQPIIPCCDDEGITDSGYCTKCGTRKGEVKFQQSNEVK